MSAIGVEHLWKSYDGKAVLRDVTLTVSPGRITCVMAPSGAGKTTLLRILLRLETPDRGVVRVPEDCRWAAVFQEDRLLEQLSARGNLRFALGGAYSEARAAALLAELGLPETGDQPVREFSGGMRRRLALARALLGPADALALDEPFNGVDEENRSRCRALIRREAAGRPVLLVTHDAADAAALEAEVVQL